MSKKLFSKVFILLLVVGLLFAAAPTGQAQAATVSTWDGTYPTSAPGDLPAVSGGVQEVTTAAQFAWLASQTNMFAGGVTTVKLMVDIDLADHAWTPSSALGGGMANTFDGNGHTISNLSVNVTNTTDAIVHAAMFLQSSYDMPLIKQLIVDGADVTVNAGALKQGYAGVVASGVDWHGSFQNVTVKNSNVTGTKYVGGIASYNSLDWINCTVTNVTLNVIEHFKADGVSRDLPHVGALVGLDNAGQVYGNTVSNLTIIVTPPLGQPDRSDRIGTLIGTAQAEVLIGSNAISGVTLNGASYTKLIGLDNRTYKVVNATQMIGYTTIQAAVTAAVDGDVINVAPGTYNEENITITKGISLLGAGAASTSIAPTAVTNNSTIIVQDPSGDVRIDGFNFVMQPKPNYGSAVVVTGTSIAVDAATVTISNNVITGSNDGSKSDYGFYGQNNNAKVIIENNTINKTGNNPICFEGQAGSTTVLNNVIRIVDSPDYDPYFSMAYAGLTVSTPQIVEGNTFYLDHAGSGYASAITFNTAVLNDWASTTTDNGHYTNIQIKNNIINTNGPEARGINLADRSAGGGLGTITGAVITGNRIIGENLTDVNTYGIAVKGDVQGAQILSNTINNVISGIRIIPGNGTTPICPSGSIITSNQITSVGVSVNNECTSGSVDVSSNWWGSTADPQAGFVGTVVYSPWCANAACTEFLPAMATIAPVAPVVCGNTTTTTIDVNISGIPTGMIAQGYQLTLHFDPTKTSIASVDNIAQGGFLPLSTGFTVRTIDNVNGTVVIASTIFGTATNNPALPLAKITLTHKGLPGDINLTLSDVLLSDADGLPIPADGSTTPVVLTLNPAVLNVTKDPDVGYCTLAEAVTAADAGDVLQLQADIAIPTTVSINKSLTLDLNGKVATYSPTENTFALNVDGATTTLTLIDGISPSTGKILVVDGDTDAAKDGRGIEVTNGGTLLFNSGTIEAPYAGVYLMENAKMTLNGGTVDSFYGLVTRKPGASLTVTTGTITADGFAISGNGSVGQAPTTILINGGTITSTATAIYHPQDGTLTINGGTISGYNGIEMKAGNLVVSDGTILGTGAFADPLPNDNGSANTGDAILLNGRDAYTGDITVTISGTPTITSTNAYALRDYKPADQALKTSAVLVSGGSFTGGIQAVTFSDAFVALPRSSTAGLMLTGGFYNTDPADPNVYVFVPYGTVYNGTVSMYEIVGISLNVHDFYYNTSSTLRGVSTDFYATNFVFSDAISVTVRLYAGEEGVYVLQQTNVLKVPSSHNTDVLTSSFDYFGTYVSNSWANTEASTFDVTAVPTRVEVTVVLPGGTLEGFKNLPTGDRTTILPGVSGLVTLQGILAPRAGVGITLTSGTVVRTTSSTALSDINYGFMGVETLTYTFTTSQARYLNVTSDSGKTFLVDRDRTLNPLRLFGGDVNGDNQIQVTDASLVGESWGSTIDSAANINYDGIVNIQDLALVGGNYGLISATAYSGWIPFTTP